MAAAFRNACKFNAASSGVGDFVVASPVVGYNTPQNLFASNGKVYRYYATNADGSVWEAGEGAWTLGTLTVARTTILSNSDNSGVKIAFATPPIVDIFPSPPPTLEVPGVDSVIPATTQMLFSQANAPTGWTKITTHNDKTIRIVSGTGGGSGGTNSFTSTFASRTSDATTLSIAQMPAHTHTDNTTAPGAPLSTAYNIGADAEMRNTTTTTGSQGGGSSHTHTYDMRVQYVDMIIASKDVFTP